MYEETKRSIDWKGIFLKVIIAFLIVLIAVKGYTTFKGNDDKHVKTTTETTAESKSSSTFTENIEKLRDAGEKYYTENTDKLPKETGNTTMITLNELIDAKVIDALADEEGKTCDGESSYVTATLEGDKTKIKANLVCGSSSSYSLVYMGENDSKTTEEVKETTTSNGTTTTKTSTSTSSNKTTSTNCGASCSTPSVIVNTNTNVTQSVSVNKDTTSKNTSKNTTSKNNTSNKTTNNKTKYYTVSFDSNGGNRDYSSQDVKQYDKAYNPGTTSKSGYNFIGWYLNGEKYDFSTPVTKNITLVAKFKRNSYYYDDDYYYDNYYYDDDDYYYNNSYKNYYNGSNTVTTYVYSMGWDYSNINSIKIDHTLSIENALEAIEDRGIDVDDISKIRISSIRLDRVIDTQKEAIDYRNNHRDTFLYTKNYWESDVNTTSSLGIVKSIDFDYDTSYKKLTTAERNGFDVSWEGNRSRSCTTPFSVNGVHNLCNYGIIYKVTWQYQL